MIQPSPGEAELAFATVAELSSLLERKRVSPVELAQVFTGRLERLGPRYNAVAALMRERALAEARRAEAELGRGRVRGPLHGIPYGAKDLLAARGAPTTWGAPPYHDRALDYDAAAIQRLGRARATLAAKLATVELAGGGGYRYASASLQGPGRTPWNVKHWSGGSSSGSGAAVAAGLVPFAIGSETSGSILSPASNCGVTGLRPTYGLVSRHGAMTLSWTLDKLGPMAHSAEDCGLVLEVLAGADRRDTGSARRRFRYAPLEPAVLRRVRLGFSPADFEELAAEAARPAMAAALEALRGLGTPWAEVLLPPDLPYGRLVRTIMGGEAAAAHGDLIDSDSLELLVDAKQKEGLRSYLSITAREYLEAQRQREHVRDAFRELFARVDVLVSIGLRRPAPRIDQPLDDRPAPPAAAAPPQGAPAGPGAQPPPPPLPPPQAPQPGNAELIPAANLAGVPALCLPCGFTPDGLPISIQLVGPPFSENTLLSLGAWYQSRTDWHRRRPPIDN
jgi:aspartyl-tRNA(Asn)/glutamyl-tRNA(Gln) amidotransferase subunit A